MQPELFNNYFTLPSCLCWQHDGSVSALEDTGGSWPCLTDPVIHVGLLWY